MPKPMAAISRRSASWCMKVMFCSERAKGGESILPGDVDQHLVQHVDSTSRRQQALRQAKAG